jgi:hypothetical protein
MMHQENKPRGKRLAYHSSLTLNSVNKHYNRNLHRSHPCIWGHQPHINSDNNTDTFLHIAVWYIQPFNIVNITFIIKSKAVDRKSLLSYSPTQASLCQALPTMSNRLARGPTLTQDPLQVESTHRTTWQSRRPPYRPSARSQLTKGKPKESVKSLFWL